MTLAPRVVALRSSAAATLTVQTSIEAMDVYVDGNRAGVTPITLSDLTPGTHLVKITHPDFLPEERNVTVASGEVKTLTVAMTNAKKAFLQARIKEEPKNLMFYARLVAPAGD